MYDDSPLTGFQYAQPNTPQRLPFSQAHSFDDLLADNRLYLAGKVWQTPYYLGPLEEETAPLIDMLLRLNGLRFFSIGSQPAVDCYTATYTLGLRHDQQKGFIDGFIEKGAKSERLIRQLQRLQPDFFMNAMDMATGATITTFPRRICVTRGSMCTEGESTWVEDTWHGGGVEGFFEAIHPFDDECQQIFHACYGITICSSMYGDGCAVERLLDILEEEE
jgi:hypothetical protein